MEENVDDETRYSGDECRLQDLSERCACAVESLCNDQSKDIL